MIGTVRADQALLRLTVIGPEGARRGVEAVLDTGFTGFLTRPLDTVNALQLPLAGNRRVTLGDGTIVVLDVYLGAVIWDGRARAPEPAMERMLLPADARRRRRPPVCAPSGNERGK